MGEAPGAREDELGKPFVGASGDDLNRYLADVGIVRAAYSPLPGYDSGDEVFVTNVVHIRPPNNKFEALLKPKPHPALLAGVVQLKRDIDEIKPNLVLALGDVPLRFLTNKHSITKYRGSILESTLCKGQKVLATFHPASVFRQYENKALIQLDMKRVAEEMKSPEINLPARDIRIWPAEQGWAEKMFNAGWLSVDIETDPETIPHKLICVAFSDHPSRALVIPAGSDGGWQAIQRLCASPAKKCGQNAGPYDKVVLEDNGIELANFQWDIMYSHHAMLMEAASGGDEVKDMRGTRKATTPLRKGLAFQASIYTREPFWKDEGKTWKLKAIPDITEFYRYNGKDAAVTFEIREAHERELDAFGVRHVFEHEMALLPLLTQMTRRGIKIDLEKREAFKKQFTSEIANLQGFLDSQVGSAANAKSPKQMHALLYDKLGLPVQYHRETKRPTANKDAIIKLAAKYQHPVLLAILEIRKRRDLLERYIEAGVDADGRMRCLFDPSGTRTGRLASRANVYGSGTNLQNIPPRLRQMFVADPGKILFYVDLSQAEARVVAWLARCESLIELFLSGRDIHKENAIRFFGEYREEKRIAVKRIVHGCVDDRTEVLTRNGWISVASIAADTEIAQWDQGDTKITWAKPSAITSYDYAGPMYLYEAQAISQFLTPDHRMPYRTCTDCAVYVTTARDMAAMPAETRLPLCGVLDGSKRPNKAHIQLIVAIQADGSYTGNKVHFHLNRERKICRLREILSAGGVAFTEHVNGDATTSIRLDKPTWLDSWLAPDKSFSWRLLDLSIESKRAFIEELKYWDGTLDTGESHEREAYFTKDLRNAEIVKTMAHTAGSQALVRAPNPNGTLAVGLNRRRTARKPAPKIIQFSGTVYCPTVPTGMLLIRRHGEISITGNSNYGEGPDRIVVVAAADGIRLDRDEVVSGQEAYFMLYPEIKENWWADVRRDLRYRLLTTPLGWKRQFYGRWDSVKFFNEALAFQPQCTVGVLAERGMLAASRVEGAEILLNEHDAIVGQCDEDKVETVVPAVRNAMEIPFEVHGRTLTIPADAKVGRNWADWDEKENPEGLKKWKDGSGQT